MLRMPILLRMGLTTARMIMRIMLFLLFLILILFIDFDFVYEVSVFNFL